MVRVMRTRLAAAVLCSLVILLGQANLVRADQPTQAAVDRAANMVQTQKEWIRYYMYPFSEVQSATFKESKGFQDGSFDLMYRFNFKYNGQPFWGEMTFAFDINGKLLFVQPGSHNTTIPPGTTAETIVGTIRGALAGIYGEDVVPRNVMAIDLLEWYLKRQ